MIKYITPWFLPKNEFKYWDLYSDTFINHFFSDGDKYEKVVWFHPSEYNRIIEDKAALEKIKSKCNLEIWLGNFNTNNPKEVINWPMYTWQYSYYNHVNYETVHKTVIDKLYVCLNRKSKYHRCILADHLAKFNLIDKGYFSWCKLEVSDNHIPFQHYNFKYFDNEERLVHTFDQDIPYANEGFVVTGDYFSKGFVHILPEAIVDDYMFIGMKFAQVCLPYKPYLFLGTKGIHKQIKNLGFELYEEIFDYDFDNYADINKRVEGIVSNLLNIQDENFVKLNKTIEDKLKYNKNHFVKLVKDKNNIPEQFWSIPEQTKNIGYFKKIVQTCIGE